MDTNEMKKRIMELSGEIEEILKVACNQKTWESDYGSEAADIISHLGYIDFVIKKWKKR